MIIRRLLARCFVDGGHSATLVNSMECPYLDSEVNVCVYTVVWKIINYSVGAEDKNS